MIKVLFLIHDLGRGGAEKVLVNLVNNMNHDIFDITVCALFGNGINEQYLSPDIQFYYIWNKNISGNSKIMKLFSPQKLHDMCVKDTYDIEVSYLEGPSARIISGCRNVHTKLVSWIHCEQRSLKAMSASFRSRREAVNCYNKYNQTVCVSQKVKKTFCDILHFDKACTVLYNTVESEHIISLSQYMVPCFQDVTAIKLIAVGTLKESKGYCRMFRIVKKLYNEGINLHLYVLGDGPQRNELIELLRKNQMTSYVTLLGYDQNPYKYISKADIFVCTSFAEGFSTATTEALILGTPVCTVNVSGMNELLGNNNEYGIVTENDEDAFYMALRELLMNANKRDYYKNQAYIRGKSFNTKATVQAVENMLLNLRGE